MPLPKLDNDFPVLVYEYDKQGFYTEPLKIRNAADMKRWMWGHLKSIIRERRQLRITNLGDDMVYHIENGNLLFDGKTEYAPPGRDLNKEMDEMLNSPKSN